MKKIAVAIDPLALLLPAGIYAKLVEKIHPHVPSVYEVSEALKKVSATDLKEIAARRELIDASIKMVDEALAGKMKTSD